MARLKKCYGTCNGKYYDEDLHKIGDKNYCLPCYNTKMQEKKDREALIECIKQYYNVTYPTGMQLKQIKEYKEQKEYKYKGMLLTLKYCKEVLGMEFNYKMGIGIIPHYYDKARAHWIELQQKRSEHKDFEIKPIYIKLTELKTTNNYKEGKLINLEEMLNE